MNKQSLRVWAKNKRKELDIKNLSSVLVKNLQQNQKYKKAKNIMLFYPLKDEVDLLALVNDKAKNFYLPRINGENLLCCPYDGSDSNLCVSCFNTKEPTSEPENKNLIDVVIIPALACDKNNFRLGYGGGFYDRFLKDYNGIKIICIPKALIVDSVFPEKHDIKADVIIST